MLVYWPKIQSLINVWLLFMCVCVLCMLLSFHSQCKSKFKLSLGEQNVASIMQTRITVCSHTHINYAMCLVVLRDMWNIWNSKHLKYKQIEWDKAMGSRLPLHIPSWHTAGQTNEIMHRLPPGNQPPMSAGHTDKCPKRDLAFESVYYIFNIHLNNRC